MSAAQAVASLPPIRLIWPTVENVRQSLEGWSAGGSLCCNAKNIKPFFFKYLHLWDGKAQGRDRAMPHIKSYTRYETQRDPFEPSPCVAPTDLGAHFDLLCACVL